MNPIVVGIIGTFLVFFLLFLGMPIAFALMSVGLVGLSYLSSVEAALPVVARTFYEVAAHYQTAVMGRFLQSCQQAPRIIFTALYYSSSVRGVFLLEALHVDRIESLLSVRDVFYLLEALFMVLKADCPLQVCFCCKGC